MTNQYATSPVMVKFMIALPLKQGFKLNLTKLTLYSVLENLSFLAVEGILVKFGFMPGRHEISV